MSYMLKNETVKSIAHVRDKIYFTELYDALKVHDFSNLNFYAISPRCFSVIFDNYQMQIEQTDVYYYTNAVHKLLRFGGRWSFKEGELERYAFHLYENEYPMHLQLSSELMFGGHKVDDKSDALYKNNHILMQRAAMATNQGFYRTNVFAEMPKSMLTMQNSYIFTELKNIWLLLKSQESKTLKQPQEDFTHYNIKPIVDSADAQKRAKLFLYAIDKTCPRTK